jgi:Family of unknown function (DUF5706)
MSSPQQPFSDTSGPSAPPSELAGMTLSRPPSEPISAPNTKEPLPSARQAASQQFFPFMSFVHSYLSSAITLADQKAAFLFAADSTFLGYLLSRGIIRQLSPGNVSWLLPEWLALGCLMSLGISIGAAIYVVMPRLGGNSRGLIYFKAIAARKNSEQYVTDVLSSTDSSLNVALAEHSYEVACISNRKYQHLRLGMWIGALGFLAGLAYIGLTR